MKILFIILAMVGACKSSPEKVTLKHNNMTITEEFTEKISLFESEMQHINVSFSLHAGIYRLDTDNPRFLESAHNMITAWKEDKPAKIGLNGQKIAYIELPAK